MGITAKSWAIPIFWLIIFRAQDGTALSAPSFPHNINGCTIREGSNMERIITDLVKDYESGKLDRREFCKTVALAAAVYAAGDTARAQAPGGLRMIGVNHISYTCPDYTKVRDWYVSVLGMENAKGRDNGQQANLMFGPEPGKGGSFVVARTSRPPVNPRPAAQSFVDHVCYTIPNWDDGRVNAALRATGRSFTSRSGNVNVLDPFNYPVQLANSEEENPWK
jgi:catechol 2,3-dioxygenase-like lactoylglutathione lyase family enzyme